MSDRVKIMEAVDKLQQATKALHEHIDALDKTSASDMFEAGILVESCVMIGSIIDDLLEWREQRCPTTPSSGRRRTGAGWSGWPVPSTATTTLSLSTPSC